MGQKAVVFTLSLLFSVTILFAQQHPQKKKPKFEDEWQVTGNSLLNPNKHFLGTKDSVPLIFKTLNQERMRISVGGRIGIGTQNPQYLLDVHGTTYTNRLLTQEAIIGNRLQIGGVHLCHGVNCSVDTIHSIGQRNLLFTSQGFISFAADTLKVSPAPGKTTARLDIQGAMKVNEIYLADPTIKPGNLLIVDSSMKIRPLPGNWHRIPVTKCLATYYPSSGWRSPKLLIPPSSPVDWSSVVYTPIETGKVGIGVCVPIARLHILSSPNIDNTLLIQGVSKESIFRITNEGKVIIGSSELLSSSPHYNDYLVSISGKVVAKKFIVTQQHWADDEFKRRPTLEELEKEMEYAIEKGHFKEVPKEEQIQKEGLDLGEISAIQMRYIERIYWYLLLLKEENEELKAEIARLKAEIERLRAQQK